VSPSRRWRLGLALAWGLAALSGLLLFLSLTGSGEGVLGGRLLRGRLWPWIYLFVLSAGLAFAWDLASAGGAKRETQETVRP
jgi:hypothetical protein